MIVARGSCPSETTLDMSDKCRRSQGLVISKNVKNAATNGYAPAAGRLAAAMATIWARRRPISARVERSNELK
jgi:hypothetical protein